MTEKHGHGPTIALNDLSAAVNHAVERAQNLKNVAIDRELIIGRLLRAELADQDAKAIAQQTVHALPQELQHAVKPEVLRAGPGHIIIGIIYVPQAVKE